MWHLRVYPSNLALALYSPGMAERPEVVAARERLAGLLPKALETMEDLLQGNSEGARLGAARDIMDRGGLPVHASVDHHLDVDLDDRIETVLGKLAKAREVAYKGAESLLEESAGGVFEPTLFDGVTYTPRPELVAVGINDDEPVDGEIVEEEGAWWQASLA